MARSTSTGWLLALGGALLLFGYSRTDRGSASLVDLMERASMWSPSKRAEIFRPLFDDATRRYGLPPNLLMRQAEVESSYNPNARSSAGAVGIMQIIPRWHPELAPGGDAAAVERAALDPARAIPYAAKLLRTWRDRYGSWTLALAAYNAGPGAVDKYRAVPPFHETRKYIAKILPAARISEPQVPYA